MPHHKPEKGKNRTPSQSIYRFSGPDSSRHTPEKSSHHALGKNASDKSRGEST